MDVFDMSKEVKGPFRIPRKKGATNRDKQEAEKVGEKLRSPLTPSTSSPSKTTGGRQKSAYGLPINPLAASVRKRNQSKTTGGRQKSAYGLPINPLAASVRKRKATSSTEAMDGSRRSGAPVDAILDGMMAPPWNADGQGDSECGSNNSAPRVSGSGGPYTLTVERVEALAAKAEAYTFPNRGLMEALLEHKMRMGKVEPYPEMNRKYWSFAQAKLSLPPPHVPSPIPPADGGHPQRTGPATPPGTPPPSSSEGRRRKEGGPRTPPGSPPPRHSSSRSRPQRRRPVAQAPLAASPDNLREAKDGDSNDSLSSGGAGGDSPDYSPSGSVSLHANSDPASEEHRERSRSRSAGRRHVPASAELSVQSGSAQNDLVEKIAGMANLEVQHVRNCLSGEVFASLRQMDSNVLLATVSTVLSTIAQSMDAGSSAQRPSKRRRSDEQQVSSTSATPRKSARKPADPSVDALVSSSTRDRDPTLPTQQEEEDRESSEMDLASEGTPDPGHLTPPLQPPVPPPPPPPASTVETQLLPPPPPPITDYHPPAQPAAPAPFINANVKLALEQQLQKAFNDALMAALPGSIQSSFPSSNAPQPAFCQSGPSYAPLQTTSLQQAPQQPAQQPPPQQPPPQQPPPQQPPPQQPPSQQPPHSLYQQTQLSRLCPNSTQSLQHPPHSLSHSQFAAPQSNFVRQPAPTPRQAQTGYAPPVSAPSFHQPRPQQPLPLMAVQAPPPVSSSAAAPVEANKPQATGMFSTLLNALSIPSRQEQQQSNVRAEPVLLDRYGQPLPSPERLREEMPHGRNDFTGPGPTQFHPRNEGPHPSIRPGPPPQTHEHFEPQRAPFDGPHLRGPHENGPRGAGGFGAPRPRAPYPMEGGGGAPFPMEAGPVRPRMMEPSPGPLFRPRPPHMMGGEAGNRGPPPPGPGMPMGPGRGPGPRGPYFDGGPGPGSFGPGPSGGPLPRMGPPQPEFGPRFGGGGFGGDKGPGGGAGKLPPIGIQFGDFPYQQQQMPRPPAPQAKPRPLFHAWHGPR